MEIHNSQVHAELTKQFDRYQQALIDNDVTVLNELFWDNALTIRYGVGENLYGHAAIGRNEMDPPLCGSTSMSHNDLGVR